MTKVYRVENLLDTFDWLDKNLNEVGIDDSYINIATVRIAGKIFDIEAEGFLQLKNDFTLNVIYINAINIFVEGKDSKDILNKLEELHGTPYLEGTDPYVESKGGATYWKKYYGDKGIITYSITSKTKTISVKYQLSALPKEIKTEKYS